MSVDGIRMEWHWNISIARSDDRWRKGRRILDRGLRPGSAASYRLMIQARAHALLSRLLANPDQWEAHSELSVGVLPGLHSILELNYLEKHIAFRGS